MSILRVTKKFDSLILIYIFVALSSCIKADSEKSSGIVESTAPGSPIIMTLAIPTKTVVGQSYSDYHYHWGI